MATKQQFRPKLCARVFGWVSVALFRPFKLYSDSEVNTFCVYSYSIDVETNDRMYKNTWDETFYRPFDWCIWNKRPIEFVCSVYTEHRIESNRISSERVIHWMRGEKHFQTSKSHWTMQSVKWMVFKSYQQLQLKPFHLVAIRNWAKAGLYI